MKKLFLGLLLLTSITTYASITCEAEEKKEEQMRVDFIVQGTQGKYDLDEVNTLVNASYGAKKAQELLQNSCDIYASELESIERVAKKLARD